MDELELDNPMTVSELIRKLQTTLEISGNGQVTLGLDTTRYSETYALIADGHDVLTAGVEHREPNW